MSGPAEAIRRPEWHDCPAFNAAWDAMRLAVSDPRSTEHEIRAALAGARSMATARVIRSDITTLDQVDAAIVGQAVLGGRMVLPFDAVFIDVHDWYPVLVEHIPRGDLIALTPFVRTADGVLVGAHATFPAGLNELGEVDIEWRPLSRSAVIFGKSGLCEEVMQESFGILRSLLYLLQAANVDLAEPILVRQQRRDAERRSARIPLTIQVRRSRTKSIKRNGPERRSSHTYDVAGNFAHHFDVTHDGKPNDQWRYWEANAPERAIVIDGRRCYRIWRRPHVRGDGPYIPKIRDTRGLTP